MTSRRKLTAEQRAFIARTKWFDKRVREVTRERERARRAMNLDFLHYPAPLVDPYRSTEGGRQRTGECGESDRKD